MGHFITVEVLRRALTRIAFVIDETFVDLDDLDAVLGDGDLGTTLLSISRAVRGELSNLPPDLGEAFGFLAKIVARTSGSSFSGVLMTGLLSASASTRHCTSIEMSDLPNILNAAIEKMSERGGAKLGDKSVLDALAALADGLEGADAGNAPEKAKQAVEQALSRFRGEPCRVGRARLAAERSIGRDDPGMVALLWIVKGAAGTDRPMITQEKM